MSEAKEEYVSNEVPGVGEVRARKGTSTVELAGAVSFWHSKYQEARKDGFIAAITVMCIVESIAGVLYYYLRSH